MAYLVLTDGKYSSPEFSWNHTVGPTALIFLDSDKLGNQYRNDMFIGDTRGNIYHFALNEIRTGLSLEGALVDNVADTDAENEDIIFGQRFGHITDLQIDPDGYLYVLTNDGDNGIIYRIVPSHGRT